jgi:hypothetical protein
VTGADDNYRLGDFKVTSGRSIECKGQPIDPGRYPLNFVEVFEATVSTSHALGFARVAELLAIPVEDLANAPIDDRRKTWPKQRHLGQPPHVSVSIESIVASALTVYVNYLDDGKHIYVYDSNDLTEMIRRAVRAVGFKRGMGQSNQDTFAVQVPIPESRWSRDSDRWEFSGPGDERQSLEHIHTELAL